MMCYYKYVISVLEQRLNFLFPLIPVNIRILDDTGSVKSRMQRYDVPSSLDRILNLELQGMRKRFDSMSDAVMVHFRDSIGLNYLVDSIVDIDGEDMGDSIWLAYGPFMEEALSGEAVHRAILDLDLSGDELTMAEHSLAGFPVLEPPQIRALTAVAKHMTHEGYDEVEHLHMGAESPEVSLKEVAERFRTYDFVDSNYENEAIVLASVERGDYKETEWLVSQANNANRLPVRIRSDLLRNAKNLAVTVNSLSARAALRGGLSPHLIHSISTRYAVAVESALNTQAVNHLMMESTVAYSRAVHDYAMSEYSHHVRQAIMEIRNNLTRDISAGSIAAGLHISREHLSRLFRKETGETLTSYIQSARIRESLELIAGEFVSMEEIAEMFRFCNAGYFGTVFRKVMGVSVTEYRRKRRIG